MAKRPPREEPRSKKLTPACAVFRCTACEQEVFVEPDGTALTLILKYLFPKDMNPLSKQYQSYLDYYLERAGWVMELMKSAGFMNAQQAFTEWEKAQTWVKHQREIIELRRQTASNRIKWLIVAPIGLAVWTALILLTLWVVGLFKL